MTTHRVLPLLLALTLLLAQQAGLAHALSHIDKADSHTTLCEKCSAFGQLSSAVPVSAALNLDGPSTAPLFGVVDLGIARTTSTAFRSRAPPHLS